MLGLLAEAAAARPLVALVDDAQWLDPMSAVILAFAARRLAAESVALVVATHPGPGPFDGLPALDLEGLGEAEAETLLASVLHEPLDPRVRATMLAEARGNPLALLELPAATSHETRAFGPGTPGPPTGGLFTGRLAALPQPARRLLLTAAV
ncbi:LuxR family transcriptional regulator, partial [Dactylosporangium sp. NPDC051485]